MTAKAAALVVRATDVHAAAYRQWLERRPGESPRLRRSPSATLAPHVEHRRAAGKKVGLESTQSNATISKKFAVLRRVYRMLIAANLGVRENPFDSDKVPPPPKDAGRKRPTEMLDFSEVQQVLNAVDASTPKGLRDKAILCAFFGGGLRRSEVQALRISDLRTSSAGTAFLYLRATKGKRDAQQAIPSWAASTLRELAATRRSEGAADADFFFVGYTGQGGRRPTTDPISVSGIYKLFKYYCRLAGIKGFLSPHSARATAITKLLADGVPHRRVQAFSRHSSIQMVELYDKRRIGVDENPGKDLEFDD